MVAVHYGMDFSLKDACTAALKCGPKWHLWDWICCVYKSNPWNACGVSEWTIQLWEFSPCILVESLKNPQKKQLAVSRAAKDHTPTTEKSSLQRLKQTDGSGVRSQGSSRGGEMLLLCLACLAAVVLRWDWLTVTSSAGVEGAEAGAFVIDICFN